MMDYDSNTGKTAKNATAGDRAESEYKVGYGKPPQHTRFKPGTSGNPKGRLPGRPNFKTIVERVAYSEIPICHGGQTRFVSLIEANLLELGLKGAKGDFRCQLGFINTVTAVQPKLTEDPCGQPANPEPSDVFFINLDSALLSPDDMADLSHLAKIVDLGGDMTALNADDFVRLKEIVNKGRGKNITPQS
jgi:hypothetical protein